MKTQANAKIPGFTLLYCCTVILGGITTISTILSMSGNYIFFYLFFLIPPILQFIAFSLATIVCSWLAFMAQSASILSSMFLEGSFMDSTAYFQLSVQISLAILLRLLFGGVIFISAKKLRLTFTSNE